MDRSGLAGGSEPLLADGSNQLEDQVEFFLSGPGKGLFDPLRADGLAGKKCHPRAGPVEAGQYRLLPLPEIAKPNRSNCPNSGSRSFAQPLHA